MLSDTKAAALSLSSPLSVAFIDNNGKVLKPVCIRGIKIDAHITGHISVFVDILYFAPLLAPYTQICMLYPVAQFEADR